MPTGGNVQSEHKLIPGISTHNGPEARPFVFEGRRAREAEVVSPPEQPSAAPSLDPLLKGGEETKGRENKWPDRQQRLKIIGSTVLVGAGVAARRGSEVARRAKSYVKQRWAERTSHLPEHKSEVHGEHKSTEHHLHAPTHWPVVHGEHKLEDHHALHPEHRSEPNLKRRLQLAKLGGAAGIGALIYERSKEYGGRTKNYFTDSERAGERKNRRIGGAVLVVAGVIGLAMAMRYGIDFPFGDREPNGTPRPDGPPGGIDDGGRDGQKPPKGEEPPFDPSPEFAQNRGNLSSGQNPWSEGSDYARSLGYNLDPNNQQDLMTLDAIKDRVLVLNDFPDPTRLPVGTEVKLPPPEVINELYRQYH